LEESLSSDLEPSDRQHVHEFEGDIDPGIEFPHGSQILIISKDQSYLTHGIHKFPAKFFPELPRYLINRYSESKDTVLDPMCGSGTAILEAILLKRNGLGLDIDPIANLVSKVKTTPISKKDLLLTQKKLMNLISERFESNYTPNIPEFNYRDNWFRNFVLSELGVIRDSIQDIKKDIQEDVFNFYRVVFSSIIRDVSNADPHCTRTVIRKKQLRDISPGETVELFKMNLDSAIGSMIEFSQIAKTLGSIHCDILSSDATKTGLDDDSIDFAMTSPPYINAVDYPRTHQLEMYWLGFIGEGPLSDMKRKYIGTETVYKKEYAELHQLDVASLDPILSKIFKVDPRRSYITFKFFQDMKKQLQETYRVIKPGSHYCVVIGNNLIRGIRIKSHEILSEIATSAEVGFILDRMFFSGLIRHFIKIPRRERMNGEWVIILKKPV
jgi:DNA modification methylase